MSEDVFVPNGHRNLVEVAPGVWVATARLWNTTSTIVVSDAGQALVIDPAASVTEVRALARTIDNRGWTVRAGFSTHPHWDHLLWSPRWAGVTRWVSREALAVAYSRREHACAECAQFVPGHDLSFLTMGTPLAGDELHWSGGRHPIVEYPAHAAGSAALVIRPAETGEGGVMVAGDMLSDTEIPLLDEDSPDPIGAYRTGLETLERAVAEHGVEVVIPGHGRPATGRAAIMDRFAADRRYLDAVESLARRRPASTDDVADERITGYIESWHRDQLARLRIT